jgi:ribonucleoside-triphosphate reductase
MGMNEMLLNFRAATDIRTIRSDMSFAFSTYPRAWRVLGKEGDLYNLAASWRGGSIASPRKTKRFPGIFQAGEGEIIYYTNSSRSRQPSGSSIRALTCKTSCNANIGLLVLHMY